MTDEIKAHEILRALVKRADNYSPDPELRAIYLSGCLGKHLVEALQKDSSYLDAIHEIIVGTESEVRQYKKRIAA